MSGNSKKHADRQCHGVSNTTVYYKRTFVFPDSDLENLLQTSQDFMGKGISILDKDEEEKNWSFGQSVLFTVTVVTTIGSY